MATPTAADVARLRRMTGEVGSGTYTDEVLSATLARYTLPDTAGKTDGEAGYAPTFDFHAAAADVWSEKAAAAAAQYDFTADGGSFHRSQVAETAERQARRHAARRSMRSTEVAAWSPSTEAQETP